MKLMAQLYHPYPLTLVSACVQRITKILHNGSESGSEWARDLATYVYATHISKSRAKITCVTYTYVPT